MITVTKGSVIVQLPCGCNSKKYAVNGAENDPEQFDKDLNEIQDYVQNHNCLKAGK